MNVYLGRVDDEPSGPLPRYITVTPDEGAIITIAVPWAQIEAAVKAAGYEIVPVGPPDPATAHTCPRCAHRPHEPGECSARYFVNASASDPCLCEVEPPVGGWPDPATAHEVTSE